MPEQWTCPPGTYRHWLNRGSPLIHPRVITELFSKLKATLSKQVPPPYVFSPGEGVALAMAPQLHNRLGMVEREGHV